MSNQVVVTLTDKEYLEVVKLSKEKGLSISQYVKRYSIGNDDFDSLYDYLKNKAIEQPANKPFTVMSLFTDWDEIDRGVKLSLGRCFYHLVKSGKLPGVEPAGKNTSNVQLYIVKGDDCNEKQRYDPFNKGS